MNILLLDWAMQREREKANFNLLDCIIQMRFICVWQCVAVAHALRFLTMLSIGMYSIENDRKAIIISICYEDWQHNHTRDKRRGEKQANKLLEKWKVLEWIVPWFHYIFYALTSYFDGIVTQNFEMVQPNRHDSRVSWIKRGKLSEESPVKWNFH